MSSRSLGVAALVAALCLCTSCSKEAQRGQAGEDREADSSSPPNISPTAAPGVAFNFGYEFTLPDDRIAATQEGHASACEKLGLSRCRITGMSYTVDEDEAVRAELDLKLDPLIARQFGKEAQQSVESNEGKLVRLDIGSSDEGSLIQQAARQRTDTSDQIAQLEDELVKTKPGTQARANLLSQIQALQQQAGERSRAIESSQMALASTPMAFHYYGRGGVPGFRGNPVREAWQTFLMTVVWLVGMLLQALAVLVPLTVLVVAVVAIWRTRPIRAVRGWLAGPKPEEG